MCKTPEDMRFGRELQALIPYLRAVAYTLCRHRATADDLAQECLMKAWQSRQSFTLGTNMKAWTSQILRNAAFAESRRSRRWTQRHPNADDITLLAVTSDLATLELDELRRGLHALPCNLRAAILLIGAGGLSYKEAAALCDIPVGTMKSRVSRARIWLGKVVDTGTPFKDEVPASAAMAVIQREVDALQRP